MDDELKENLTAGETWVRGLFILLFAFLLVVARMVVAAVVVIQFLFTVFSGQTNDNLRYFGASLSRYIYQVLLFITYNCDEKPFPFAPWPTEDLPDETPDADEHDASPTRVTSQEKDADEPESRA
ncbi:MAG TPA: DUF4389 domain-containing protein [Gammaproteobacteria bacterium]|nr:DUF4389 domain-containing protein [Gammaproteobacteria bacterium]